MAIQSEKELKAVREEKADRGVEQRDGDEARIWGEAHAQNVLPNLMAPDWPTWTWETRVLSPVPDVS